MTGNVQNGDSVLTTESFSVEPSWNAIVRGGESSDMTGLFFFFSHDGCPSVPWVVTDIYYLDVRL